MSDDDEYEHWPEEFGTTIQREYKVIVTAPTPELKDCASTKSTKYRHGEQYVYKPAKPAEAKPKPQEYQEGQLYRYVPAREVKKPEPKSEVKGETVVKCTYTSPKRPSEPQVWLGRTKAEVAEDNAVIAKRFGLREAPKMGPTGMKDDDVVWVQDTKSELVPYYFATVKHFEGEWRQYKDDPDLWYFIMKT